MAGAVKLTAEQLKGGSFIEDEAPADKPVRLSAEQLRGGAFLDDQPAAKSRDVGKAESFLRGAAQGATLGFADEITGAIESLTTDKTYKQSRDESRAAYRTAQEANPLTYSAGDIGAGVATAFVPGLGIAKGAKALQVAGKAALTSGVSGVGRSESDDVGVQLQEGIWSGAIGGATAGLLSRVTRGAPKRVVDRTIGDFTDGVPATMRDKLVGKAGKNKLAVVAEVKRSPALQKAGRDPVEALAAVDEALEPVMKRIDGTFSRAGSGTSGISVNQVQRTMDKIAVDLEKNPGTRPLARAVRAQMDDVFESWVAPSTTGGKGFVMGDPRVSANDVRRFASAVGDMAFQGSPGVPPKAGREVAQRVWGELKGVIDQNIDEAAKKMGGPGAKELRELNKRASTLINMRQAVQYRATREATESTRLKDRVSGGIDIALALADPATFVAKKAYDIVGKPAVRAADAQLARLVTAAQNGSTPAQITQMAVEIGLGRATGESIATWAAQKFGQADAQE